MGIKAPTPSPTPPKGPYKKLGPGDELMSEKAWIGFAPQVRNPD